MQAPFVLRIPPMFSGGLRLLSHCPPDYKHAIPFAKPEWITCELGDFLTQSINGEDFLIEFWTFNIQHKGYVDLEILRPYTAVALFLEGTFEGNIIGNGWISCPIKTYNFFFMPIGVQRIFLNASHYSVLFFIPPEIYLNTLSSEFDFARESINVLHRNKEKGNFLTTLSLPISILRVLKRVQYSSKSGIQLDLELRKYMVEVMVNYVKQLDNEQDFPAGVHRPGQISSGVRQYILNNLGNPNLGGAQQLAKQFHISEKQLTKEFRSICGKTVPQFIRDERMQLATMLLTSQTITVFEVAYKCGYTDTSNFIRQFKCRYGFSPGTIKRKASE